MATALFRKNMIAAYREMREPGGFLASFFKIRPGNISDTETVSIDIERSGEEISPVVNTCEGPTWNTDDQFTTKEFTPPTLNEGMPFDCRSLLARMAGTTEYAAADLSFQAQLVMKIMNGMAKLDAKIMRNIDWQASQILQTGLLALVDEDGVANYNIDFKPKSTHFFAAGIAWNVGGSDPLADIEALADLIRNDGKRNANICIMGDVTFNAFSRNAIVQAHFDNRRMDFGAVRPDSRGEDAKFQGFVHIGAYNFEIWTYTGRGVIPGGSTNTNFVSPDSCIVLADSGRLDTVFAGVPTPTTTDPRFADVLPGRISVPSATDVSPNIYSTPNGKQTILELESRPLCIPTAIDSFGRIDSGV